MSAWIRGMVTKAVTLAVFYAGSAALANAQDLQSVMAGLQEGDMRKLVIHSEPQALPDRPFTDPDGNEFTLADYEGQIVLLNFWATWCAPCREEMPDLEALQRDYGGEEFAVVPVATGRNSLPGIRAFFGEIGVSELPILLDPQGQLARRSGVLGLPVTVLMDREGNEIARLQGGAHWADADARALIEAVIAQTGS